MISHSKINANRVNAQASTGPKTTRGRARVARNALRHGLTLSVNSDAALSEECALEADALVREIARTDPEPEMQELARAITEAQIDIRRVRHQLLSDH